MEAVRRGHLLQDLEELKSSGGIEHICIDVSIGPPERSLRNISSFISIFISTCCELFII